jgi:hypothetical protein
MIPYFPDVVLRSLPSTKNSLFQTVEKHEKAMSYHLARNVIILIFLLQG